MSVKIQRLTEEVSVMNINREQKFSTEKMVIGAIMTALVIVFQLLGTFTAFFGPFSTAVALIPIVIGAATCGAAIAAAEEAEAVCFDIAKTVKSEFDNGLFPCNYNRLIKTCFLREHPNNTTTI